MPGCCIEGCHNRSEKGFRLFNLPSGNRNNEKREEWLKLIGKNTLAKKAAICEVHFDDDQFEKSQQDGKRLLCPFGKLNLLKQHITVNQEVDNFKQATDLSPQQTSDDVQNIDSCEYESNATININENNACSVNDSGNINRELEITDVVILKDTSSNQKTYDENYVKKLKKTLIKTVAQNRILKKKNHKMYDENYVKKLRKTLRKIVAQSHILKKKFRETNTKFNAVLNKDQIYLITHDHHKGKSWSANTIIKALKLYVACGQKGYKEVRKQLPYPMGPQNRSWWKIMNITAGRFTQDALENLFSIIRGRKSVPDVCEFKTALRLVCLSQFQANIKHGNYSVIDSDHVIKYCNEIKQI
ncbi:uncharacterized protein [Anoplolepis gracilipes]|uniref:uncharacterized protein n=1 Tax=Anoplolepis gracilipes TaxID=354296 RepID=UPI003B9F959B